MPSPQGVRMNGGCRGHAGYTTVELNRGIRESRIFSPLPPITPRFYGGLYLFAHLKPITFVRFHIQTSK